MKSKFEFWVRSKRGLIAGVCQGLGERLQVEPWKLRIIWLIAILFAGTGLFLYLIAWICLPQENQIDEAYQKKILGVCLKVSDRTGLDIGLVRVLAVLLAFLSFGATVVGYLVLYVLMSEPKRSYITRSQKG